MELTPREKDKLLIFTAALVWWTAPLEQPPTRATVRPIVTDTVVGVTVGGAF